MPGKTRSPVLHLVVCGTGPAAELAPFITACQDLCWQVHVITTPEAAGREDHARLADLTHHPVRPDERAEALHPLPPADAFAVAPASFDLVNRWAYGFNDSLALRLLNEATAVGLPVVAVPAPEPALARHPAFAESLERLRHWGVTVTAPAVGHPGPWEAAARVVSTWTRFARVPAQPSPERARDAEDLATQPG
ncbi:flavoprotein [Micromonospora krabiensis]|uniref:Flavoprotein n=1 Tax=Micromonospora krabiensis TaxID=307121 RepID=A0A1C3ND21_9ACTN|nr:flavoprotein [Micromonospora krabiensis]SBV30485.1 Flavoprotein [Micromonospora krabiensis]